MAGGISGERRREFSKGAPCVVKVWGMFALGMSCVFFVGVPFIDGAPAEKLPFFIAPIPFFLLGLAFTFGRYGVTFDADRGVVEKWWSVFKRVVRRSCPVEDLREIALQHGRPNVGALLTGGNPAAYKVAAIGRGGPYEAGTYASTQEAWQVAAALARLTGRPIVNTVGDERIVTAPEELPELSARDAERSQADLEDRAAGAWADRGRGLRSILTRRSRMFPVLWPALIFFAFSVAGPVWMEWDELTGASKHGVFWPILIIFPLFGTLPFWLLSINRVTVIDRERGVLVQRAGLGPFRKRQAWELGVFDAVLIDLYEYEVNDQPRTRYRTNLTGGMFTAPITHYATLAEAQRDAAELAELLGLEVREQTA